MMRRSENRLQMRTKQLCSVIRQGMAAKRYRGQAAVNSPAEQRWDRGHACRFSYYNEGTLDTVTDRAGRVTKFTCLHGWLKEIGHPDDTKATYSYDSKITLQRKK